MHTAFQEHKKTGTSFDKRILKSIQFFTNLKVLLYSRMYLTWIHQIKIASMTTNLDVPSNKEFKSVFHMVLKDSSFRK